MTLFSHRNNYFMSMENHSDPKRMANGNAWDVHLRGGWERPCETLVNKSLSASSLPYLVRNSNRRFSPFTKRLLQHIQLVKQKRKWGYCFHLKTTCTHNRNNMGKSPGMPAQWYKVTVAAGKMLFIICRLHNTRDFSVTPRPPGRRQWATVTDLKYTNHKVSVTDSQYVNAHLATALGNLKKDQRKVKRQRCEGRPDTASGALETRWRSFFEKAWAFMHQSSLWFLV